MFDRCVLLLEADLDPEPALRLLHRLAPHLSRVHALVRLPSGPGGWLELSGTVPHPEDPVQGETLLAALRERLETHLPGLTAELVLELDQATVGRAAEELEAGLVLFGPVSPRVARLFIGWLDDVAVATGVPVVWTGGSSVPPSGPIRHILCPFESDVHTLAGAVALLRAHVTPNHLVTLMPLRRPSPPLPEDLAGLAELVGLSCPLRLLELEVGLLDLEEAVSTWIDAHHVDLVLVPLEAVRGLVGRLVAGLARGWLERARVPVLFLPPDPNLQETARPSTRLDAPDLLWIEGVRPRLHLERINLIGQPATAPDERIVVVARGRCLTQTAMPEGTLTVELPELIRDPPASLGVGRAMDRSVDPVAALELRVALIRPGERRVLLVDGALSRPAMARLKNLLEAPDGPGSHLLLAVRLTPGVSFASIRDRLRSARLTGAGVLDAGLLLDDGNPGDLPSGIEDLRLGRIALRLRAEGVPVSGVVHRGGRSLAGNGFAHLREGELAAMDGPALRARLEAAWRPPVLTKGDLEARLDLLTSSRSIPGNRVRIEMHNARALERLIAWIDAARDRIHLQVYILRDDPVTRRIEDALARAAARGVKVRLLVDSLYSLHGSFGSRNPMLDRLDARDGIEVRLIRPIERMPSIEDLKQRNHRKLVVVDGEKAVVTGRNLAAEYYRDFDEVPLSPETPFSELPWLDAGAELEGPAVVEIEAAFHQVWIASGGAPYPLRTPGPAGPSPVRVVLHHGLRDSYASDAYLALIEAARHSLFVVNTFPLQLEIQHALLRAIRRGVRLKLLCGNVLPRYGPGLPFKGSSPLRALATQLVLSRLEPLVEAGAEAYEYALPPMAGWAPGLEKVRPHVHAKILSCDGRLGAVGSANLDITAGYWESEAMLVVEDAAVVEELERELERLMAHSMRIDPADPAWRQQASRRAWLGRYWPSIIG